MIIKTGKTAFSWFGIEYSKRIIAKCNIMSTILTILQWNFPGRKIPCNEDVWLHRAVE